ncbi:MAG: 4-hydroxy-3-methylbut-2-enyl diphosphate reductase [Dehalococcoidia bacterium]|nr:4-hydroxy-3-methylbut-2-enyl diphosphate reductase [Dehalococcoidia bacterium]
MQIILATDMGFCFGVRRAIVMMEQAAQAQPRIESLGAVVHNPQVVDRLSSQGVQVVKNIGDITSTSVAITAHGVGPDVVRELEKRGLDVLDTTCPIVERSQIAAKKLVEDGFIVVVYGNSDHPETRGVLGWAGDKGIATTDHDFLKGYKRPPKKIGILAQTTQVPAHFTAFVKDIMDQALEDATEIRVVNTLCNATSSQQEAAIVLATQVQLMVVVGGRNSANTRHLAELCTSEGVETYHIERADEIDSSWLVGKDRVGVTAGASTPDEAINAVVQKLEEISKELATDSR